MLRARSVGWREEGGAIDDFLLTVAEIAVAFTGFAGVASVFGRSRLDPRVQVWRIRAMIAAGLLTVFGALGPFAIRLFSSSAGTGWRISAALLSLAVLVQLLFAVATSRPLGTLDLIAPRRLELLLAGASLGVSLFLALVAIGLFEQLILAVYAVGVLYLLALSSHHFFVLILGAQPGD